MFYGLRTPVCIRSEEAARAVIQDVDKVLKEKGPWPEDIKKACIALREDPILPPDDTAAVDLERFRVLEVPNEPDLDFVALEALSDEELGRAIRLALPVIKGLKDRIDQMNDVATSCRTQLEGVIKQLRFGTDPARTGG